MPTRERLAKAADDFEITGIGTRRIVRMLDAPLEQALARAQLSDTQFAMLDRLRWHWFQGHCNANLRAVDLNRVTGHGAVNPVAVSDREIWHRKMFDTAIAALQPVECEVATRVVLVECSINETGAGLGYRSLYRGRQAVLEILRTVAQKIMSVWLTMDR